MILNYLPELLSNTSGEIVDNIRQMTCGVGLFAEEWRDTMRTIEKMKDV